MLLFLLTLRDAVAETPVDIARAALGADCGEFEPIDIDLDETAACRFWFREDQAAWSVRLLQVEVSHDSKPMEKTALAGVQREDVALIQRLGVDVEELDDLSTNQIAAVTTEDGVQGAPEYQVTMTAADRRVSGVAIVGSRVVVVRNNKGDLLEVVAFWPDLSAADLRVTSEPEADTHGAAADGFVVTDVDAVYLPTRTVDGAVLDGEVYSEVFVEVENPFGGARRSSRLYRNGTMEAHP